MMSLFIAVAFFFMCQQEVFTDLRFNYFKRVVVKGRKDILWSIDDVFSKLKCTTLCLAESKCATFGFVEAKGSCQAFSPGERNVMEKNGFTSYYSKRRSVKVCEKDKDCYDKGSVCFRGRCMCDPEFTYNTSKQACVRTPGGMYQHCVNKTQCYINGSVCFKGRCMCTPGLSYHKAEQACVRNCSTYGKTMSMYTGLAIAGHNKIYKKRYSKRYCIHRCTTTTDFLCLSVKINVATTECALSRFGYLDVNEKYRTNGNYGWLFGTRDCAFN